MAQKNGYPGWAYLLAGLMIGLFVAFIVYLQNQPTPNNTASLEPPKNDTPASKPEKTEFDFYKILPEIEVVVPDLEVKPKKNPTPSVVNTTQPSNTTPANNTQVFTPPKANAELAKGEHYILQVGSFKKFEEADKLKARLAFMGLETQIQKVSVDNATWHRVRVGPYQNNQDLNVVRQRLQDNNMQAVTLKVSN
ncbi:MAG: SPOR domain-containing protein [Gammaproteobacteria bacterium]|nr:SPOR domain-containing protein [Gammaproteobacteria bacterium]